MVVDASVVVAAVSPNEDRHEESLAFLRELHRRQIVLLEPPQFLLELYAVLNRSPRQLQELGFMRQDNALTIEVRSLGIGELQRFLDWATATFPGRSPTGGADLAYVSVALETRAALVTNDRGLHEFGGRDVTIHYPGDLLAAWGMAR